MRHYRAIHHIVLVDPVTKQSRMFESDFFTAGGSPKKAAERLEENGYFEFGNYEWGEWKEVHGDLVRHRTIPENIKEIEGEWMTILSSH